MQLRGVLSFFHRYQVIKFQSKIICEAGEAFPHAYRFVWCASFNLSTSKFLMLRHFPANLYSLFTDLFCNASKTKAKLIASETVPGNAKCASN